MYKEVKGRQVLILNFIKMRKQSTLYFISISILIYNAYNYHNIATKIVYKAVNM